MERLLPFEIVPGGLTIAGISSTVHVLVVSTGGGEEPSDMGIPYRLPVLIGVGDQDTIPSEKLCEALSGTFATASTTGGVV